MTRYEVTAWIGTITADVEAEDEDDAIDKAMDHWIEGQGQSIWASATYEAREIQP